MHQTAQKMLSDIGCGPSDNRQLVLKKNISRLLRSGAMAKAASPHVPVDSGLEAQRHKAKSKLLTFLKAVVPTRLKVRPAGPVSGFWLLGA